MIEREMEQTRASLVEKVAALENQVVGTLQTATSTVKDTVETVKDTVTNVKEAVTGTVESVKDQVQTSVENVTENVREAFDLRTHIQRYPWACVGAATAAGFGVGLLLGGNRSYAAQSAGLKSSSLYDTYRHENGPSAPAAPMASRMASASDDYHEPQPRRHAAAAAPEPRQPGLFDQLWGRLSDEITKLGEEAFRTLSHSLRENISTALPQIIENAVSSGTHAMQNAVGNVVGAATGAANPHGGMHGEHPSRP